MGNSFLRRFMPQEPKFFPILSALSDVIVEISDLMIEFIKNYSPETTEAYYKKIKDVERKGDKLSNQVFDELNVTFITPFDREDIHELSNTMDDVIDHINSSAKRIHLYKPKELPKEAIALAETLQRSSLLIEKSVDELNVLKKRLKIITEYCNQLHYIENEADDIYEHFIIDLFQHEKDGVELIKKKEIMYELENATDVAESVGKIIKTIIVKYA